MSFHALDAWWGPYLFILLGGWLTSDGWRYLGVYLGGKIAEESITLVFVRTVATALVAAVIGNLLVFPSGALADVPLAVRIAAAAVGFVAFLFARKNVLVGILSAEAVLLAAIYLGGFLG